MPHEVDCGVCFRATVVVGAFGLVGLLLPGPLFDAFGGTSDVGSQFVVQLFGAALLGEALIRFGMRRIPAGELRAALLNASVVEYAVALAASLIAQTTGVTNTAGIAIVALYAFFALGYAYARFVGKVAA